jgi:enamine deaminase RidA (YjgF/YER057c/UK114 family)
MNIPLLRGFAAFFIASVLATALQATETPQIERVKVDNDIGYSELVRAGDYVYIAGHVGWNTMPEAVKIAYDSIGKLLKENGLSYCQVVKENVFTDDIEAFMAVRSVRNAYYGGTYPAATWVQITRLGNVGFHLEVELVVYDPVKK